MKHGTLFKIENIPIMWYYSNLPCSNYVSFVISLFHEFDLAEFENINEEFKKESNSKIFLHITFFTSVRNVTDLPFKGVLHKHPWNMSDQTIGFSYTKTALLSPTK